MTHEGIWIVLDLSMLNLLMSEDINRGVRAKKV